MDRVRNDGVCKNQKYKGSRRIERIIVLRWFGHVERMN